MFNLLPKLLKMETKLLRNRNLSQKPLQTIFVLFLNLSHLLILRIILTTLVTILFNIPYISDADVKRTISHLLSTKCVRPDEIPNFFIKILLFYATFSIFLTGSFPLIWKQAAVVPLFQEGNSALVTNYRPILFFNHLSETV
jgi:hypothetical protein